MELILGTLQQGQNGLSQAGAQGVRHDLARLRHGEECGLVRIEMLGAAGNVLSLLDFDPRALLALL